MSDPAAVPPVDRDLSDSIAERVAVVQDHILAAGRRLEDVTIVAVTKGFGAEMVRAARAAGLTLFGENYADELLGKATELGAEGFDGRWTFQGRLQSNKINRLAPIVALWQTVGSAEQAAALAKRVPSAEVFVQLNLTGRPEQGGVGADGVDAVIGAAQQSGLHVRGLMGIGPDTDDRLDRRRTFAILRRATLAHGLAETSMGMSDDYLDALAEGSTMIRLGSVLFGRRPTFT